MYIHLVFTIALSNNKLFYPHFWDEDIEACLLYTSDAADENSPV